MTYYSNKIGQTFDREVAEKCGRYIKQSSNKTNFMFVG